MCVCLCVCVCVYMCVRGCECDHDSSERDRDVSSSRTGFFLSFFFFGMTDIYTTHTRLIRVSVTVFFFFNQSSVTHHDCTVSNDYM